jgi:hypothetical protein
VVVKDGAAFCSWIVLTLTYPPPGTPLWLNTEHIIYYGRNIASDKGRGSIIYVSASKFVVSETPEEIERLIAESKK